MVSEFTMKNASDEKTKTTTPPTPTKYGRILSLLFLFLFLFLFYSHFNIFNIDFWDVNINMKMTPDFNKSYRNQCSLGWVGGFMVLVFNWRSLSWCN